MAQNSKKKTAKKPTAVAKKSKKKPKAATKAQKEAVESRIKEELAQPAQQPKPEVVGIIEKKDLKQLLSYRNILLDSQKRSSMLQTAYNAMLTDLRARYGLPDECLIDDETGIVRTQG